ncbi:hypothetical protein LTR12_004828 [Friedmanniomyces endolithicus]|nr:hypothetical protein LTR74_011271 [Friedmanniomyces endolithicus]KAK1820802.1 hypothetical protein LTR12_004828 [Friedmanniomyces endolithicus]
MALKKGSRLTSLLYRSSKQPQSANTAAKVVTKAYRLEDSDPCLHQNGNSIKQMASQRIPPFYRIFFTTVDPLIALTGFISALFFPNFLLSTYSPTATIPPAIETTQLLNILAGFYLSVVPLQIFLLRARPQDLTVWRALQFSVLIADVAVLGATATALSAQGRLQPSHWRLDEAGSVVVTAGVGLIRIAFLIGLGMGRRVRDGKEL